MPDDPLQQIMAETPTIQHFFIAFEEIAAPVLVKQLPGPQRRSGKPRAVQRWRRAVTRITDAAKNKSALQAEALLCEQPLPGFKYAGSAEDARNIIEEFAKAASTKKWLVGVHEELLSSDTVLISLWRD